MANEEQLAILKEGVDVWNEWRATNLDIYVDLSAANLSGMDLHQTDLRGANLQGVIFSGTNLENADLGRADLFSANLRGTKLKGAKLSEANLKEASLSTGDLNEANFIGANLSNAFIREADLSFTNFSKANLSDANLSLAHLLEADFFSANLRGAKLIAANLNGIGLRQADLWEANLSEANLQGAELVEANFSGADLKGANLSKARVGSTVFANSDLSKVLGLDDTEHRGPSSISTDVLAFSKGKIPEAFLRGCGLSDADIEYSKLYNPSLSNDEKTRILYKIYDLRATQAIQISPLFISYSHGNTAFVEKLEEELNKKGIRFWRDIHDMKAGRIEKQIDQAIRQNPTVLLVLSKDSLSSDWVEHEVRTARELEKELGRDTLCPVALDDSWKTSRWPKRVMEQIMEYNILDFSAWKDDSKFDSMFRKLIDGLELFYKG